MEHKHGFAVDAACECGIMISEVVADLQARLQAVEEGFESERTLRLIKEAGEALEEIRGLLVIRPHRFSDQSEKIHAVLDAVLAAPVVRGLLNP